MVTPPVINSAPFAQPVAPGQVILTGSAEPNADLRVLMNLAAVAAAMADSGASGAPR
ncbi:MAG: hypothetical protein R2911_04155 [Caldilineaceae bacterium]